MANSTSGTISVLDTASDTVTATLSVAAGPVNIAFSPDSRNAYVTDYKSATLVILNAASGDLVGQPIPVQAARGALPSHPTVAAHTSPAAARAASQ